MSVVGSYAALSGLMWIACLAAGIWLKEPPKEVWRAWIGANIVVGIPYWLFAIALVGFGVI